MRTKIANGHVPVGPYVLPQQSKTIKETELESIHMRIVKDEKGTVAILFALTTLVAVGITGVSIDAGRFFSARHQMQAAADAAALAAAGAYNKSTSERISLAQAVFKSNVSSNALPSGIIPEVTFGLGSVVVTAHTPMSSMIMQVLGFDSVDVGVRTSIATAGKKLELAVMLDVTGSMDSLVNGVSKLNSMKSAARDLMDIVIPTDGSATVKVSIIPFSEKVNAGTYAAAVTNKAATSGGKKLVTCVTERTGTYRYDDDAPASGRWIGFNNPGGSTSYSTDGKCKTTNGVELKAVQPLTNSRTTVLNLINSLDADGNTAGHLGTAWAYYTLSPLWNSIWPLANRPVAYTDVQTIKAAILMTDGEYNKDYTNGNPSSSTQARALCTKMKADGIEVFTIGFGIGNNNTARTTLQQCATDADHYFFPYDGDELRGAFASIGQQLSEAVTKTHIAY